MAALKKTVFAFLLVVLTVGAMLLLGEVLVRFLQPVEYLYPRYKFSAKYGLEPFENTRMVHGFPGKYRFYYTVNEMGHRGRAVPLASHYKRKNVVVLGDSYAFGMGVDDGDEFPSRLDDALGPEFDVANLGSPGWGLTQEIRRYYDIGSIYHPEIVILQFCANDPEDNFNNMVTVIADGEFVFRNHDTGIHWVKKYLSKSPIQKSQLYNFFRGRAYEVLKNALLRKQEETYEAEERPGGDEGGSPQEKFYCELLEHFAHELRKDGVRLVMIAVNDQLARFPRIEEKVLELDRDGALEYVDVVPWFEGVGDYESPEGHVWGATGHEIIGQRLAEHITSKINR